MILYVAFFITIVLITKQYIANWKIYRFTNQLDGPLSLPLIGSAYLLLGDLDDTFSKIWKTISRYQSPVKLWIGQYLFVVVTLPDQVKRVLLSSKITQKHDLYDVLKLYGGEGMISGSGAVAQNTISETLLLTPRRTGPKWKHARKLTQPHYDAKFVDSCSKIMQRHIEICMRRLDEKANGMNFDIESCIHYCVADIIGESILGMNLGCQLGKSKTFLKAMKDLYINILNKITRPWYHIGLIYKLSSLKQMETAISKILNETIQLCHENLRAGGDHVYISDENKNFVPSSIAFMKSYENDPGCLDDIDFRHNLLTLYAASEDTITAIAAAACMCFGMYPECQDEAFKEIESVLGTDLRQVNNDDVNKLTYLDMCVKETLRLFPIAPFILRKTTSNFKLDKWTIPENCAVMISIFSVHLDRNEWERPKEFYPEHFTAESVEKRHSFAYIPFSAGPRGCIGKLYAQASLKILLTYILQRYIIEADGKYEDVFKRFKSDISVRPRDGYIVRLRRRR